jgi:hypothetical protein
MSRLTQAFGFLKIDPDMNTRLYRIHNLTSYTPSNEMIKLRRKLKLWEEDEENKDNKTTK